MPALPRPGAPPLVAVPSLGEVLEAPTLVEHLPPEVCSRYYAAIAVLEAALRARLFTQIATAPSPAPRPAEPAEEWLSPAQAAARFGVTRRWLLDHQEQIPGRRRLSRKMIRFNARALASYLRRDSA